MQAGQVDQVAEQVVVVRDGILLRLMVLLVTLVLMGVGVLVLLVVTVVVEVVEVEPEVTVEQVEVGVLLVNLAILVAVVPKVKLVMAVEVPDLMVVADHGGAGGGKAGLAITGRSYLGHGTKLGNRNGNTI